METRGPYNGCCLSVTELEAIIDMPPQSVTQTASARIPTTDVEFRLVLYENDGDDKDHLALVYGDISDTDVLVRIHSECFTGDVLGSLRCDCGEQLEASMRMIAEHGAGVLLYLRQEGRGIGLLDKLRAYNLQDDGYDTVDANLALGHGADERDYTVAALILNDLGVRAVRLITNNPDKIDSLKGYDIDVSERVPVPSQPNRHNGDYLRAKVDRMRHMLELGSSPTPFPPELDGALVDLEDRMAAHRKQTGRPFVTLSYAQSLDGSIAARPREPLAISGPDAMALTHRLRATHDAILVGIDTLIADDPQLTVRKADGDDPIPVVLDSQLRFPPSAQLLDPSGPCPWIATGHDADPARAAALEARGACLLKLPTDANGQISLPALLAQLGEQGMRSLMVEGGSQVLSSFLRRHLADHVIVTVAPMFVGGVPGIREIQPEGLNGHARFPRLTDVSHHALGDDLVLSGTPDWEPR